MTDRPTPETDNMAHPQFDWVRGDFARKLERERDEALEQRDKIAKAVMRHLKYAENHHRNEVEDDIDEELRAALNNLEIITHD